ncbi:carbohydrate porin [Orenia marismortui]|uniref:Maltoporin/sucrose porin n=1 Tax=Orenia marismortui TaxID=46469 RepID=A0A4R8H012_9FIRM|nr:carbohydrate porin [Orenia marismortui]TDX52515.1 maltoporin/sucrose porin [Orenia marismortui]
MKKRFSLFLTVALMVALVALPAFAKTSVRPGEDGKVEVTFTYAGNPDANAVYVAGEFNNWLPNFPTYKMKKENGVWTLTTQLEKGKYQYKFTVYGGGMLQWIKDDDAASFAADGFGGQNSVVIADPNAGLASRVIALEKQMAVTNIGFNYSGYARAGYVMTTNGGALGASHVGLYPDYEARWRLGNEDDTYVEQTFSKKFTNDNGASMNAVFMLANKKFGDDTWLESNEVQSILRQAYVEANGMDFAPELTFWAGERYYGRSDIHITDHYWRDLSGYGAGIQGIKLGNNTLDVAYIGRGQDDTEVADLGEESQQNLDFRLNDIAFAGGNVELELIYSWQNKADSSNDKSGFGLAAVYNRPDFFGLTNGASTVALQHGKELGAELGKSANWYMGEDAKATKLLAFGVANLNEKWDVMPELVYYKGTDLYGAGSDADKLVVGARFANYITKNFAMQYELGHEMQDWGEKQTLTKFTVAPTIKWDSSFWARPELRVFASYFTTNDNASIPTEVDPDGDSGMTYGVQMEVWW